MLELRPLVRSRYAAAVTAAVGAVVLTTSISASASNNDERVAAPPAVPTTVGQIQNIDQVRTAIKGYFGDMIDPERTNPIDGAPVHTFDPNGNYAKEVGGIVTKAKGYLGRMSSTYVDTSKAIVLDVDDTTLSTYSYEIYSNFAYNSTSNAAFVNSTVFRAVPHMVSLEKYAEAQGYTVFFITGRPEAQRAGTIANLENEGYDVESDKLFLKNDANPIYSSCAPACSRIQYKSLTRKYIESLGYSIAADLGDQYSDLIGGHTDRTYKIPNPMYYLP